MLITKDHQVEPTYVFQKWIACYNLPKIQLQIKIIFLMLAELFQFGEIRGERFPCTPRVQNGDGGSSTSHQGKRHRHTVVVVGFNFGRSYSLWGSHDAIVLAFLDVSSQLQNPKAQIVRIRIDAKLNLELERIW